MNTYATKPSDIQRKWYVVDAEGVVLGHLSAEISRFCAANTNPATFLTWTAATMSLLSTLTKLN